MFTVRCSVVSPGSEGTGTRLAISEPGETTQTLDSDIGYCQLSDVVYTRRLFIGMLSENVVWNIIIEKNSNAARPEDTRLD